MITEMRSKWDAVLSCNSVCWVQLVMLWLASEALILICWFLKPHTCCLVVNQRIFSTKASWGASSAYLHVLNKLHSLGLRWK